MLRIQATLVLTFVAGLIFQGCGPTFKNRGSEASPQQGTTQSQPSIPIDTGPILALPEELVSQPLSPPVLDTQSILVNTDQCIQSLCGPAVSNRSSFNSLAARAGESPIFNKLWNDVYATKVKFALSFEAVIGQTITGMIQGDPQFKLKTSQARAYRAMIGTRVLIKQHAKEAMQVFDFDPETRKLVINQERFNAWIANFPTNKANAIKFITTRMLAPMRNAEFSISVSVAPLTSLIALQEPGAKTAKQLAATVIKLQKALEEQVGYGAIYLVPPGALAAEKVLRDEKLSFAEEKALVSSYGELIAYSSATSDEGRRVINQVSEPLEQVLTKFKEANGFEKLKTRQLTAGHPNWESTETRCKAQFRNMMEMNPVMVRRTKALAYKLREIGASVARSYAKDGQAAADIVNKVSEIEFNFSERGSVRLKKFRVELDQAGISYKRNSEILAKDPAKAKNVVMLKALLEAYDDQPVVRTEAQKLCDTYAMTGLSDATLQAEGKIDVSWFTAVTPEVGAGVIAHEIGHVVSFKLRNLERAKAGSTQFLPSLNCISTRNRFNLEPKSLGAEENSTWSEEDWADHFAAAVISEFKKSSEGSRMNLKNFACGMAIDDGTTYPDRQNKLEPQDGDSHSNGFFRMLVIHHDLGGDVTPQCQPFVDHLTATGRNLTCH